VCVLRGGGIPNTCVIDAYERASRHRPGPRLTPACLHPAAWLTTEHRPARCPIWRTPTRPTSCAPPSQRCSPTSRSCRLRPARPSSACQPPPRCAQPNGAQNARARAHTRARPLCASEAASAPAARSVARSLARSPLRHIGARPSLYPGAKLLRREASSAQRGAAGACPAKPIPTNPVPTPHPPPGPRRPRGGHGRDRRGRGGARRTHREDGR
jgi:hypothetical protein